MQMIDHRVHVTEKDYLLYLKDIQTLINSSSTTNTDDIQSLELPLISEKSSVLYDS